MKTDLAGIGSLITILHRKFNGTIISHPLVCMMKNGLEMRIVCYLSKLPVRGCVGPCYMREYTRPDSFTPDRFACKSRLHVEDQPHVYVLRVFARFYTFKSKRAIGKLSKVLLIRVYCNMLAFPLTKILL